ncbi:MAG: hypothetical protein JWN24_3610 [Phycisphaerales bacterium]|nr:hypothetical protein [Phycisphaerales bacterium]
MGCALWVKYSRSDATGMGIFAAPAVIRGTDAPPVAAVIRREKTYGHRLHRFSQIKDSGVGTSL